jgi:hypothetical protein
MCIDVAQYRARIGIHNLRCITSPNLNGIILLYRMLDLGLLLWFILLLLRCGDIESNPGPTNCILLNTRSVKSVNRERNKLVELQTLVNILDIKMVCLTETWLSPDIADSEILPTDKFNIHRRDRCSTGGGDTSRYRLIYYF